MPRFRLRFLLQEFDVPLGETLIGRSPECRVSIDDPLVSRQHARLSVAADGAATLEDLGSRNGSRVNGALIRGPHPLKDGDRVRFGTQELVFCKTATSPVAVTKQTGFLLHCARCHLPYPEEMVACPNCGATERADDREVTAKETNQAWSLQLLLELLERALRLDRMEDADRVMEKVAAQVEERAGMYGPLEAKHLVPLGEAVLRLASRQKSARWARWVLGIYAAARQSPSPTTADLLLAMPLEEQATLVEPLGETLERVLARPGTMTQDEIDDVRHLELVHAKMRVAT